MAKLSLLFTSAPVAIACAVVGCASYPAPHDHLATSMASLRAAQEIGAARDPQAALHVRLAQEEVNHAEQLMADGDNERADYETMRANADAQLALMLMRENAAKNRAQEATARLQQVGSQTMVTSGTQPAQSPQSPQSASPGAAPVTPPATPAPSSNGAQTPTSKPAAPAPATTR